MVQARRLTHRALAVSNPERSLAFHAAMFGVREYFRDAAAIQLQGAGPHDVIAFEQRPSVAGDRGGILHFGFRLRRPRDIHAAAVESAGGTVVSRDEFGPGLPHACVRDPDGYEIEIWFE
jgi:catechol 2,3-dioxygenase-like lactoylglutathione lyase family enzyme